MERRGTPYWLTTPGLLFLVSAFVIPLLLSVGLSVRGVQGGLLAHYQKVLTDPFFLTIIWRTIRFSLTVTSICLLLGYPVAYLMSRLPQRWATTLLALTVFPILVNSVVRSFAWMVVLGRNGIVNNLLKWLHLIKEPTQYLYTPTAVILGLTQLFLPMMILSLYSTLSQVDPNLEQASRGLGAGPAQTFRRIIFPLSIPGMVVGATLVFSACMTAFTTPQMLGGSRLRTLATIVYYYANVSMNWPLATAIALLMFLLTMIMVAVPTRLLRPRG